MKLSVENILRSYSVFVLNLIDFPIKLINAKSSILITDTEYT